MITSATSPADSGATSAAPAAEGPGLVAWYAEGFSDRLGDRLRLFDNATTPLELLRFSPAVTDTPGFESSLRFRLGALASFRHPAFALVRSLTVLDDPTPQLALVSELASGERLSAVLLAAQASGVRLDATSAIWLLRHLLPALAAFHDATGGIQHGWLDPDRIVVTASGDVSVTEYLFGGLLDDLAVTPPKSDVCQAALLAAAVLLGRPLRLDERRGDPSLVVEQACQGTPSGDVLRPWLLRAVARPPAGFRTAQEAYHALEELLPGVWGVWPSRALPPAGSGGARGRLTGDVAAGPVTRPTVFEALLLPGNTEPTTRKLAHVSRTLAAVVLLEAACIGFLVIQIATTNPSPAIVPPAPVQMAGFLPSVGMAGADPAYALGADAATPADTATGTPAAPPVDSVTGWLVMDAAVEMKVYVNGRLMGYATRRRFGLPAGEHTITFVNDDYDYTSSQTIRIAPGRSVLLAPRPPSP
jgi:hypothetical protein